MNNLSKPLNYEVCMSKNRGIENLDLKIYIVPLLLISGFFFVSGFFVLSTVRNHYYDRRNEEAVKLANSYAHSISKFTEGEEIVHRLLEDKIRVAASSVRYFEGELSNEMLKSLAETLDVDEVDFYNERGYLEFSNLQTLIGWEIYPGHPIDSFLKSGEEILVEDIRQDVITGDYYKYGYLKLGNGSLIQVGIRANTVYDFLERFSVETLLDEMKGNADALHIDILGTDLEVIATTEQDRVMTIYQDESEIWAALNDNSDYSYIYNAEEGAHYDVIVPLKMDDEEVYALSVGYSLEETTKSVKSVSLFGLGALGFIYASILYNMHATYRKSRRLHQTAYYDELTELPNKVHLEHFIASQIRNGIQDKSALMMINIQNFKQINLTYGYIFGDLVLRAMAAKLKSFEKDGFKLFRFSVDRFALYSETVHTEAELLICAEKIAQAFEEPLSVDGAQLYLSVKSGIVVIDETYKDVNRIVKDASVALEEIRNRDVSYVLFDEKMFQIIQREDVIVKEIRAAVDAKNTDCLYLEYQPVIDTKLDRIAGFEALARMNSQTYGRVSPLEFIEAAEKNMLIVALGGFFLDQAMKFIKELEGEGLKELKVAVNISGIQLIQKDFTDSVLSRMKTHQVRPEQLELEITESILFDKFDMINSRLKVLSDAGIHLALDDFGTGYSSFVRLQELHIDTLKIDRHFIGKLIDTRQDVITGDIIRMAHRYGLKVVAEGVENELQKEYLLNHDCDYIQGYLYSPSVSGKKAKKMVMERE